MPVYNGQHYEDPNDRPGVCRVAGVWQYRASICGFCTRALVAARLGYMPSQPPAFLVQITEHGKALEQEYKNFRRQQGVKITGEQLEIIVPVPSLPAALTGHMDGIEIDTRPYLLEVKSMSDKQFMKWMLFRFQEFPTYLAQISVYSYKIRLPIKYVVIPRSRGIEYANVTYYTYKQIIEMGGGIEKVFEKIRRVEEWAKQRELPECDSDSPYCNFDYLCDKEEI